MNFADAKIRFSLSGPSAILILDTNVQQERVKEGGGESLSNTSKYLAVMRNSKLWTVSLMVFGMEQTKLCK